MYKQTFQLRLVLVSAVAIAVAACGGESAPESAPAASQPAAPQPAQNAQPQPTPANESAPQSVTAAEPTQPAASEPAPAAASQDACGNRYIPFLAGAQWQYQVSGDEEKRFTRAVVSVSGNQAAVKDIFEVPADEPELDDEWQCNNGALVFGGAAVRALVDAGGSSTGADIASQGVTLPADPKPGETWSQTTQVGGNVQVAGQNVGAEVRVETTCRAIGFETVSVPAGAFEALRADCTETVSVKASVMGLGAADVPVSSQYSEWYAAGVGLVKRTEESSETVLLSYRLP